MEKNGQKRKRNLVATENVKKICVKEKQHVANKKLISSLKPACRKSTAEEVMKYISPQQAEKKVKRGNTAREKYGLLTSNY